MRTYFQCFSFSRQISDKAPYLIGVIRDFWVFQKSQKKFLTNRSESYIVEIMNKKSKLLHLFISKCQENNLKITPQRTVIYQELLGGCDHPSADLIYGRVRKRFPHISLDTVNRALLAFAGLGIITVVEGYGKPKRFDPDIETHHHFQCMQCYKIIDFRNKAYDRLEIPNDIKKRLTVFNKKVILEGLCSKCSR